MKAKSMKKILSRIAAVLSVVTVIVSSVRILYLHHIRMITADGHLLSGHIL